MPQAHRSTWFRYSCPKQYPSLGSVDPSFLSLWNFSSLALRQWPPTGDTGIPPGGCSINQDGPSSDYQRLTLQPHCQHCTLLHWACSTNLCLRGRRSRSLRWNSRHISRLRELLLLFLWVLAQQLVSRHRRSLSYSFMHFGSWNLVPPSLHLVHHLV